MAKKKTPRPDPFAAGQAAFDEVMKRFNANLLASANHTLTPRQLTEQVGELNSVVAALLVRVSELEQRLAAPKQ